MHTYITHRIKVSLALIVLAVLSVLTLGVSSASALSGSEFEPGYIIDDAVFYDRSTMNPDQIQAFLDAKVPVCDTNGTQLIYDSSYGDTVTRATYSSRRGISTPFTCLKDYTETIPTIINSGSNLCTGSISGATKSAAQIIHDVAQACGINPQVLIVLLQKEQSLVSDTWPWPVQYRSATGYGCPDTAPCDAEYYGYFNQVYQAAKAYKRYAANPNNYNYRYGRNNYVLYNPNTACGGTNVYIQNQATASLYIYTPYQPNAAALNSLYGLGDGCSAYGNRNFWRMFNDWFGSTRGSYLLRSVENSTVYLVSEGSKFPIPNLATLNALYPMGEVKFVSQAYLNELTTMPTLKRLIKGNESSTLYFFDAGIKLAFTSCAMVEHYGMTCGDYAELQQVQINKFVTGPNMTDVLVLKSGKVFKMTNGLKREAVGTQSLIENGYSTNSNTLSNSVIDYLSYGVPIVKQDTLVKSRSTEDRIINDDGTFFKLAPNVSSNNTFKSLPSGELDQAGINLLTTQELGRYISGVSKDYIINDDGISEVQNIADWSNTSTAVSDGLLALLNVSTQQLLGVNDFYKTRTSGTVYEVTGQQKNPIPSWKDLTLLSDNSSPTIKLVPAEILDALVTGNLRFGSGRLVKTPESASVFMVDGLQKKPVTSFSITDDLGLGRSVFTVSGSFLSAYGNTDSVTNLISCESSNFVAHQGYLKSIDAANMTKYGFDNSEFLVLDTETCSNISKQTTFGFDFIRPANEKTIYKVESGTKRPIGSYAKYLSEGGVPSNTTVVSPLFSNLIPTGLTL